MEDERTKLDELINKRYLDAMEYYWDASRNNKKWYKLTRSFTVILGALVTLIASLSSAKFIEENNFWDLIFSIATPVLAACLTVIAGFSQSFQWGSAWQNMVLTAQRLRKEYDRYLVTEPSERDFAAEADLLNKFIITETESFFERMLGGVKSKIVIQRETVQHQSNNDDTLEKE